MSSLYAVVVFTCGFDMHLNVLSVRYTNDPTAVKLSTERVASSVGDLMWAQRCAAYLLYLGVTSTRYLLRSASLQKSPMLLVIFSVCVKQVWNECHILS